MTWGEFQCRLRGWQRWQEARLNEVRLVMWAAISPHSKRRLRPQDIMELPMDSRKRFRRSDLISKEKYKELIERWLNAN